MPWEMVADFRRRKEMTAEESRWGALGTAFALKLGEKEPRLRLRIRNLPYGLDKQGNLKRVFSPLQASEVPAALHMRLDVPEGRSKVVRQYYCKTCGTEDKPKWVPQMYAGLHHGHDLTRSDPTGRVVEQTWQPNRRLFVAAPARLSSLQSAARMFSVAVTTMPALPQDLSGYDVLMLLPTASGINADALARLRDLDAEQVLVLPSKPEEAVAALLAWILENDKAALEKTKEERESDEIAQVESVHKRILAAEQWLKSKSVIKPSLKG